MTVIVVAITEDRIAIGTDSLTTFSAPAVQLEHETKLHMRGRVIYSYVGDSIWELFLKRSMTLSETDRFDPWEMSEQLFKWAKERGHDMTGRYATPQINNAFVFADVETGDVWYIDESFAVTALHERPRPFLWTCGSGWQAAQGAIYAHRKFYDKWETSAIECVEIGVEGACAVDRYCGGKLQIQAYANKRGARTETT